MCITIRFEHCFERLPVMSGCDAYTNMPNITMLDIRKFMHM